MSDKRQNNAIIHENRHKINKKQHFLGFEPGFGCQKILVAEGDITTELRFVVAKANCTESYLCGLAVKDLVIEDHCDQLEGFLELRCVWR